MSSPRAARVPASLARPGKPDRLMSAYELLVRPLSAVIARTRIPAPERVDRDLAMVVAGTARVADEVLILRLKSADGAPLPRWHPGAHLDLVLPSGRQRQYSLCGDPGDRDSYRIAVRRIADGGGGSVEIHDSLAVGTALTARGPRNGFPFAYPHLARADISRVEFIAAGIGITAIWPMVAAAAAAGVDWHLIYLGRTEDTMAFLDEIIELDPNRVRIHTGARLDTEELLAGVDAHTSVYFCGPSTLLSDVRAALDHLPNAGFHFERFSPAPVLGGRAFQLRLDRTRHTVEVASDESALAAVQGVLPEVAYSCQQGFCGTCRVRVVAGEVARRGQSSFGEEPDSMLICVDRAASENLSVDL